MFAIYVGRVTEGLKSVERYSYRKDYIEVHCSKLNAKLTRCKLQAVDEEIAILEYAEESKLGYEANH